MASAHGTAGVAWFEGLDDLVEGLERDWDVIVGRPLSGGSCAYVAEATTMDGKNAILKLGVPSHESLDYEIKILRLADGRGYVRLLRHDVARNAILLERLGARLSDLNLPLKTQIEIICGTLQHAWISVSNEAGFESAPGKARSLALFIERAWQTLGRPCAERTIEQALSFANVRARAFDRQTAILVHGDAHNDNTLQVPGALFPDALGFKFVDPDGFLAERAYDLGILMRSWSEELLPGQAVRLGRDRCAFLSRLTGVEERPIWQWGLIERVSTGLFALQMGADQTSRNMLKVADEWAFPGADLP
jgi:streptomycin 6-kinase